MTVSVCLSTSISQELHVRSSPIFLLVTYVVALSSSGGVAIVMHFRFLDDVIFAYRLVGRMHGCRCNTGTASLHGTDRRLGMARPWTVAKNCKPVTI